MTPTFRDTAENIPIDQFKEKFNSLKDEYLKIEKQFNKLSQELEGTLNESLKTEIINHLSIYLSEMNIIKKKFREISDILKKIRSDIDF